MNDPRADVGQEGLPWIGGWKPTGRYRHTKGWFGRVKVEIEERRYFYGDGWPQSRLFSETRWRRATPADLEMDVFTQEARDHG